MATGSDIRAALGQDFLTPAEAPPRPALQTQPSSDATIQAPQPKRFKKSQIRSRGKPTHWSNDSSPVVSRKDHLQFRRWQRANNNDQPPPYTRFGKYHVQVKVPVYNDEVYSSHLTNEDWTKDETDHLIEVYRDANGKWPVIADRYDGGRERTMEELKARFYSVSAIMLSLTTPIHSMTGPQYALYDTLQKFDPSKEASRKKLAEGHLQRKQQEVDEETVLLGELQRIMLHLAQLDSEREDLRRRLDHPVANTSGYQYNTSQSLTQLWQQLLAADRLKKNQRLRPTGKP